MFESFQSVCANTTYACAAGVGVVVVAYGTARGMKFLSGGVKCVTAVSFVGSLIIGGMVVTNSRYAAAKTNDTQQVGSDTNQMENGEWRMENAGGALKIIRSPFSILHSNSSMSLVRVENWYRRGAWEDGKLVRFDADWCFPLASNHLTSVELWSQGKLFASERAELPFAALTTPLALVPRESEVFFGRTANNSYRFEWVAAHPNRDAAVATNAAIEIFRNGDFEITEGGVTTRHPYDVPFAHDGFGQDDDWVRANFTNATEILAAGYTEWVEEQVGVNLTNGLYRFTASFAEVPPEPTRLFVGDVSVAVTNAGDYVFVLKKGKAYEFGTWPDCAEVDYWAEDDLGLNAPVLMSVVPSGGGPGEWSVDGGWCWLDSPWGGNPGSVCWMPVLQGSPNVSHLGEGDFPATFTAVLRDYCGGGDVEYRWRSTDANVRIASPGSPSTQVTVDSLPGWGGFSLCVEAVFDGYSLYSHLPVSYGAHEVPQVRVEVQGPNHVWVNSPPSADNVRTIAVSISSDVPTSGTFRVSFVGNEGHLGITRTDDWEFPVYDISTLPVVRTFARLEGLSPCAACDEECFSWTFQTADGEVIAGTNRLTVCRIASVDVWSEKGGTSPNPPPFPGQTAATFCVTNSASPDRHYPVFFCDVVDTNLCIQPYSVEYRVATLPEDLNLAGAATSLTQLDGPPSGSFRNAQGKTAFFDTPREGGVYKVGVAYGDSPVTETILLLPLAGAAVDAVVLADRTRADTRVTYINSHFPPLKRQWPSFGLKWFNNDGMGDYLGRVDSVSKPTVWPYNQVNDETGMGAVATWRGLPLRMAKISNFLVGYTTKRIGVWSVSRGLSQGIGTHNDESATMSWDAGVAVADGADFDSTTGSMVTNAWKVSDQKERRLWPNPSPADNHTTRSLIRDFNLNFISPGFTERIP